jgi:hypothetical protein
VPSPPGAAAFNVSFKPVQRSQPEFAAALVEHVRHYYDVRMTPR